MSGQGSRTEESSHQPSAISHQPIKVAVLTVSDKGHRGERVDESGKFICDFMLKNGAEIIAYEIIPDEQEMIEEKLIVLADQKWAEVIFTTGGTGFATRDVTPEATQAVIDRQAPGLAEAMRHNSLEITPHAMLSRAISGIRGRTLIVNLPGSPKAVKECLEVILPALPHGVEILAGRAAECASRRAEDRS